MEIRPWSLWLNMFLYAVTPGVFFYPKAISMWNKKSKPHKVKLNVTSCSPIPIIPYRPFADSLTETLTRGRQLSPWGFRVGHWDWALMLTMLTAIVLNVSMLSFANSLDNSLSDHQMSWHLKAKNAKLHVVLAEKSGDCKPQSAKDKCINTISFLCLLMLNYWIA